MAINNRKLRLIQAAAAKGGGVPVVDELVAIAGQSNAGVQGVSGTPSGWTDTPRVKMWNNSTNVFETYSPAAATAWGPEAGFALSWLADHPSGTLYIVKNYLGGSQLGAASIYGNLGGAAKDWSQTAAQLFPETTAIVAAARAACGLPLKYVIWAQGEADAQNTSATADYATNALELYTHIRSDWGDANTKICAHMVSNRFGGYNFEAMVAKQRQVVDNNPLNFLVDTRGFAYYTDNIHLVAAGSLEFGRAAYFKLTTAQTWFDKHAVLDLDFTNSRFFYRNLVYNSIAELTAAGYYISAAVESMPVDRLLSSQFSIFVSGTNPNVDSATAQYAVCIDDGNDGVPTDEFVAVSRVGTSTKSWGIVVFHTSTASVPGGSGSVNVGAANGTDFKTAVRARTNDMNAGSGGSVGTTASSSAPMATGLTNLVLKNRTDGTRPWAGTLKRVQILDYLLDNAAIASVTA
ncbi:sialate O-acetylesterase [Rhizobium sp. ZK1]|uniref:sialate O-acetylesterase n=1 Tax=Rhizobium sp. ZK1 TaxID=3389872 RepID=UPI0039F66410